MALLLAPRALRRLPQVVQSGVRRSHEGGPGSRGADEEVCRPHPCCAPPAPRMHDVHVTCTPPLTGRPPPCAPPRPPPDRTCHDARTKDKHIKQVKNEEYDDPAIETSCAARLDAVTLRLASAERQRRRAYERETAASEPPPPADFGTYCLAAETATDIPPICPTEDPSINCDINRGKHIDPCAHNPKTIVKIDRTGDVKKSQLSHDVCSDPLLPTTKLPKVTEGLTTRIMEKFKRGSNKGSQETTSHAHGGEPSLVKRLCYKPGATCGPNTNSKRTLHTTVAFYGTTIESELNIKKYDKVLSTQIFHEINQPKEKGHGRIFQACFQNDTNRNEFFDQIVPHFSLNYFSKCSKCVTKSLPISLYSRERSDLWLSLKDVKKKISNLWKQHVSSPKTSASTNKTNLKETEVIHAQYPCDQHDKAGAPK